MTRDYIPPLQACDAIVDTEYGAYGTGLNKVDRDILCGGWPVFNDGRCAKHTFRPFRLFDDVVFTWAMAAVPPGANITGLKMRRYNSSLHPSVLEVVYTWKSDPIENMIHTPVTYE